MRALVCTSELLREGEPLVPYVRADPKRHTARRIRPWRRVL